MGKEAYEAMVREHLEVEKQLGRTETAVSTSLHAEQSWNAEQLLQVEQMSEKNEIEDSWDVVSTGSVDLDEWEEVMME
jgi:hypothetical protein